MLAVLRYVERNALRASLCERAEDWKFGSLWRRVRGDAAARRVLADWPLPQPRAWLAMVNRPQSVAELKAIQSCVQKGCPYGSERYVKQSAARLQLDHTLRPRGRPQKID